MGYQESYIRMGKSTDFASLIDVIKTNKYESFILAKPVEIITLQKPISGNLEMQCNPDDTFSFDAGEKFIYVVGERSAQRSSPDFFAGCKNVPRNIIENLEIYFAECFPSEDIFKNNIYTKLALHEKFCW